MENKRKNIYIVIFVITTIIASCVAIYFKLDEDKQLKSYKNQIAELSSKSETENKSNEELNKDNENKTQNTNENTISVNDLFAFDMQVGFKLAKVVDGKLYVWCEEDKNITDGMFASVDINEQKYKLVDSDVKRIKAYTLGSDTAVTFLVIKNNGQVYELRDKFDQNVNYIGYSYNIYAPLKDYLIDDINNIRGVYGAQGGVVAEVVLLDGTIKEINTVK